MYSKVSNQPKQWLPKTNHAHSDVLDLDLDSRIVLRIWHGGLPKIPGCAQLLRLRCVRHTDCNSILAFDKLHRKALRSVPRDMAMHQPGTRVIFGKGNRKVAVSGQRGHVTARRVDDIKFGGGEIEHPCVLSDHPEVMAVQMNRVVETVQLESVDDNTLRRRGDIPDSTHILNDINSPLIGSTLEMSASGDQRNPACNQVRTLGPIGLRLKLSEKWTAR
jgi:hypothetical protein